MLVETEHIISSDKNYFICQIGLRAFLNNQLFIKKIGMKKLQENGSRITMIVY